MSNTAVELFTAVPKTVNCAQAVAAGTGHGEMVDDLAASGGGKAPEGLCGALYSALLIVPESRREMVRKKFIEIAGAADCVTLKMRSRTSCVRCVDIAAELVEKYGR